MNATWAAIIGGIVAALVTGAASVFVARLTSRASRDNAITAPYEVLAKDVVALRKELREDRRALDMVQDQLAIVMDQRDDMGAYIRLLIATWPRPPAAPPPPPPPRLAHALADPAPDRVVETTTTTTRRVVPLEQEED